METVGTCSYFLIRNVPTVNGKFWVYTDNLYLLKPLIIEWWSMHKDAHGIQIFTCVYTESINVQSESRDREFQLGLEKRVSEQGTMDNNQVWKMEK